MADDATSHDELAVARVLSRYCHALDDHRYDDVAALFADDGVLSAMGQTVRGRVEIREFFPADASPLDRPETLHLLTNVVVEVDGAHAGAVSDWAMVQRDASGATAIALAGRYHDVLRRSAATGDWRIAERTVTALARPRPAPGPPENEEEHR